MPNRACDNLRVKIEVVKPVVCMTSGEC